MDQKKEQQNFISGNFEWANDKNSKVVFVPTPEGSINMYDGKRTDRFMQDEIGQWGNIDMGAVKKYLKKMKGFNITWFGNHMAFWLSVVKKENAIFSRRNGIKGMIILGYSIRLRILNKDII